MCVCLMSVYVCECLVRRLGEDRGVLGVELQAVVRHHVGAGN